MCFLFFSLVSVFLFIRFILLCLRRDLVIPEKKRTGLSHTDEIRSKRDNGRTHS